MAFVFVPNRRGITELLRSPTVAADLKARAERIAQAARGDDEDLAYHVHSEIGRNRARAAVVTASVEAHIIEAREHRLARAIDAGRD